MRESKSTNCEVEFDVKVCKCMTKENPSHTRHFPCTHQHNHQPDHLFHLYTECFQQEKEREKKNVNILIE